MATNISQRFSKTGDFYLLVDTDLRGGFRIVNSIAERDAIPIQARKQGMIVRVIESGEITNWELGYGLPITNAGWIESSLGGKGDYIPTTGGPLTGELNISELGFINFSDAISAQVFDGNLQFTKTIVQDPDDPEPMGMMTFNDGTENTVEINPQIGQIVCKTEVAIASDRSLKTNIKRIENSLAITRRMYGYMYELISQPGVMHTGLIAQEVKQAIPAATVRMSNGKLAVVYGNLMGLAFENIHDLEDMCLSVLKRLDAIEKHLGINQPEEAA